MADQPVWRSAERLLEHLAAPALASRESVLKAPFLNLGLNRLAAWEAEAVPPQQQSLAQWVRGFAAKLRRAGWGRNAGSVQRQALQTIAKRLDRYAELEQLPAIDHQQALQTLGELLAQSPFAAERPSAPILALGYLETTGLHFSHLWVAGMTDTGWPMSRPANPCCHSPCCGGGAFPASTLRRRRSSPGGGLTNGAIPAGTWSLAGPAKTVASSMNAAP